MFKWFNNLRINAKLFAILALPLVSLLYFSINGVVEKYFVAENMRQVETLAGLSTRIGAAVHELQRERGTTALFLGSQGARSAAELASQRAVTDGKIEELKAALQEIETAQFSEPLRAAVDEALGLIETLPETRSRVDDLQISGADSFAYYTSIIDPLLDATSQIATLSRESEVARHAATYQFLLQAKERAGRERALLSEAFSAGRFSADEYNRFLSNLTEQDTYIGLFLGSATEEQQSFYRSRTTGADVDEVARMKQAALEAGPGASLNADADLWFEAATIRINLLKEVEDRLASGLADTADRTRQDALLSLWTFVALMVVSVTLALASGFFLSRSISSPLQAMERASAAVAAGDLDQNISIASRDEIGLLAKAFNSMTAQLRDLIGTLEQRVAERTKALATVAEVGTATSTILETDKLLQEVADLTKERFGFYHAHIYLLDDAGDTLVLSAGAGEVGRQMAAEGRSIPLDREQSLVARAARERKGVTVNDVTQTPDFLPHPLLPNTRSELAVPMIVGESVVGVLDVQADTVDRFTEAEINIQTALAAQVAVAVQNARQYQQTIQTAAELAGFQGAVSESAIVAITDVGGRIEFANDNFVRISKYSREELIGQDHRILNSGYHSKEFIRDLWVTIANGKVWRNEIFNKAKDGSHYWVDTTIAPILNERGKPVKYVAVRFDITERKKAEEAVARRAAELATVAEVSTAASTVLDPDRLLQSAADLIKERFVLYHAHIYLLDEEGGTLVLAAGAGEVGRQMAAEGRSIPLDREQSLVARAARERLGVTVNDVTQAPDFLPHPLLPATRSEMAVPMIVGERVVGVLDVQSDAVDHFTEEDIRIHTTLAAQIAVAVQNARTFTQARRQAERETMLNVISQKIQSATSVEAVLQIAARELGRALDAPLAIAQLGMKDNHNGSG